MCEGCAVLLQLMHLWNSKQLLYHAHMGVWAQVW